MYLWGLVVVLLAASVFLTDVPVMVQRGLLVALGVTTGVAALSSLIFAARVMQGDGTQSA